MFADWLSSVGLGTVKPVISALALPPVPFIVFALAGAGVTRARPRVGRCLVALSCLGIWLSCCNGSAYWVEQACLKEPAPLDTAQRDSLKTRASSGENLAIVVLGGGMDRLALEYGSADLGSTSLARLRYAVWLGRQTGIPVAASGGRGWGATDPSIPAEGTRMAEVARTEFDAPLRWTETGSRDTHENAENMLALLQPAGVREVVLVTTGSHMPRALREFRAAAAARSASGTIAILPATMGQSYQADTPLTRWMPSGAGLLRMHQVVHEALAGLDDRR